MNTHKNLNRIMHTKTILHHFLSSELSQILNVPNQGPVMKTGRYVHTIKVIKRGLIYTVRNVLGYRK